MKSAGLHRPDQNKYFSANRPTGAVEPPRQHPCLQQTHPLDPCTGLNPGFIVQHVAYPQIDAPQGPQRVAWNARAAKPGPADADDCDTNSDYEIGIATQRLISLQRTDASYCHGQAHGIFSVTADNAILQPTLRPLTAPDVFGSQHDWQKRLGELLWSALAQSGWAPPLDQAAAIERNLKIDVSRPGYWLFTPDGLSVNFSAYEGGCYPCTPPAVTLPWAKLRPLLSPNAPVP